MTRTLQLAITGPNADLPSPDKAPAGVTVTDAKRKMSLDGEGLVVLSILVQLASDVYVNVLASWLYDTYFKRPSSRNKIEYQDKLHFIDSKNELEIIIERKMSVSEGG